MHKFKVGDAVQTRDGCKARIVCDDARFNSGRNLAVLVEIDGAERFFGYFSNGTKALQIQERGELSSDYDLIPAPRRQTVWLNVYRHKDDSGQFGMSGAFYSRSRADLHALGRVACIRVELEEGRFDE